MATGFSSTATNTGPFTFTFATGAGEAVFNVDPAVELLESLGLKVRELAHAEELVHGHLALIIEKWHEHLTDTVRTAGFRDGWIVVELASGGQLRFPVTDNSRLARGTPGQLNNIEVSPFGLHWPDLDEDLSLRGIAEGDYGRCRNGHGD